MKQTIRGGLTALALAGAIAAPGAASAAATVKDFELGSAAALGALCADRANPAAIHMCQGFLLGVNNVHDVLVETFYCLPPNGSVTRDAAAAAFASWAASKGAEAQTMTALDGLVTWAMETYPCN